MSASGKPGTSESQPPPRKVGSLGAVRSDWDEIFSEIEAESETPALPRPPAGAKIDVLILGATGVGSFEC